MYRTAKPLCTVYRTETAIESSNLVHSFNCIKSASLFQAFTSCVSRVLNVVYDSDS